MLETNKIYECCVCGKKFIEWRKKPAIKKRPIPKYCSKECAHSRKFTKEIKNKIANSIKKYNCNLTKEQKEKLLLNRWGKCDNFFIVMECPVCHKLYKSRVCRIQKHCSRECACKDKNSYKNCGGYREGSGRSKSGYYKGIYCGSTYELVYVIYRLDNNLTVKRFDGIITDGKLTYIPDFIENNTIIEIKGYYQEAVDKKSELAKAKGYNIKVLYKEDLQKEFDWVKNHYKYKKLQELYDDYKPKYKYICDCCGKEFETDIKRQDNKLKFCSRECVYHDKHKKFKRA